MSRQIVRITVAVTFALFWTVAINTTVDWIPSAEASWRFIGGAALLVALPAVVGIVVNRWWAPLLGAVIPVAAAWPSDCSVAQADGDYVLYACPEEFGAFTIQWGAATAAAILIGVAIARVSAAHVRARRKSGGNRIGHVMG